ncbi:MAG: YceI family protein [Candidatus Staskawiczbacteria bacterium]|nr:YceI family protein [Candidatus Staskawiczbacteria bacterium]
MDKKYIMLGVGIAGTAILGVVGFYFLTPAVAPTQTAQESVEMLPEMQSPGEKTFAVIGAESSATYQLGEVLNGKPTQVIGTTSDIAGSVVISMNNPSAVTFGEIKINARTFKTDIANRDNNVRKLVLKADEPANEFIVFKPTSVTGVPATLEVDKEFPVTIIGDITIAGVTKSVTFTGNMIFGTNNAKVMANTMLAYEEFGVFVPNFPFLANVDKMVKLSVSLVAK